MFLRRFAGAFPLAALLSFVFAACAQAPADPWNDSQTVQPAALNKELSDAKTTPLILFVGYQRLFNAGHIKGTQFHGSGGSADGLAQLKAWATPLPRSASIVIYCGCCPLWHCPNVRPAFVALRDMGFTKVRVLLLPTSFEVDWAEKGLPYDRGQ